MTNYMDNYLRWMESTTPEERLNRGRHFPDESRMTDVTGGHGGPARRECGGCGAPISFERGEWRSVYTTSMWCPEGAR